MNLHLTQALVPYEIAARWRKDGGFTDSYAWHKRAWDCFPGRQDADRDFLTRLDDTGNGFRLLILSYSEPAKPDWCPDVGWQTKSVGENFLTHPRYRFSLLANPTRKLASPRDAAGKRRSTKRLPISTRADLLAWLERKATQHGFSITSDEIRTIPQPRQYFVKAGKAGLHTATEFTGVLTVTDPALLHEAFTSGIGSAKAFGFGMLCLSPL
jgi:CRISPR system Cascade subunit CasE